MDDLKMLSGAEWIWCGSCRSGKNICVLFRKCFFVEDTAEAELCISADWDYKLWINGVEAGYGQFPDYPDRKTVTAYPVKNLKPGKNVIAVMVYAPGDDFFAMLKGVPGLLLALEQNGKTIVRTDSDWKAIPAPEFRQGVTDKVSNQLGFAMEWDLRKAEPFASPDYDDSAWSSAVAAPRTCSLAMRPLPPIVSRGRLASRLIKAGNLCRQEEKATFALSVAGDDCDVLEKDANGRYWVYDFGAEVTGYAELEFDGAADGTVVDLSWGESLQAGRVRNYIDGRNFTVRVIARAGYNRIDIPFLRLGCRYLQLNVVGSIRVIYAGVREYMLSLPPAAKFDAAIPHAARLREIGLHTLHCCMHAHYEDCPWREQGLYGYDSRNQMLFGYYAWGNYPFARASLDLLGEGYAAATGEINICAPTNYPENPQSAGTIPAFSRIWMRAMAEYALYSGDLSLAEKFVPQFDAMLTRYCRDFDEAAGLFRLPEAPGVWNFFEWVPELSRPTSDVCDFHILHNLYTLEGIRGAVQCFALCGKAELAAKWRKFAETLGKTIEAKFYQPSLGIYASMLKNSAMTGKAHTHVQFMMLALGLVPEARAAELGQRVLSDASLVPFTFSPLPYFMQGMFAASPECRSAATAWIDREFLAMADAGASTFWETGNGEYDFDHAGSLCHGWSCIHVGYYGKYTLGVTPLEPGFRRFEVKPWCGSADFASGEIPTPNGMIEVAWRKLAQGGLKLEVTAPAGLTPEVAAYPEFPVAEVVIREK